MITNLARFILILTHPGLLGLLENLELLEFSWNFTYPPGNPWKPGILAEFSWNSFPYTVKNHFIRFLITSYSLTLGISAGGTPFHKDFPPRRSNTTKHKNVGIPTKSFLKSLRFFHYNRTQGCSYSIQIIFGIAGNLISIQHPANSNTSRLFTLSFWIFTLIPT